MNSPIIPPNGNSLAEYHIKLLKDELQISSERVSDRSYTTQTNSELLNQFGFSKGLGQGLLVPLKTPDGLNGHYVYRLDEPKEIKKTQKAADVQMRVAKYVLPKGQKVVLDCPLICQDLMKDPSVTLWITDDPTKADILASHGMCAVAIVGIWDYAGKKNQEEIIRLNDWDHISLVGRSIRVLFDLDVISDPQVNKILNRLTLHFVHKSQKTKPVFLSKLSNGMIDMISDWFSSGRTAEELEITSESAKVASPLKPAKFTIGEDLTKELNSPLCLIDDRAYAVTWVTVKETIDEEVDDNGNLITLDSPKIKTNSNRMIIIRDDGQSFGGSTPIDQIGLDIHLREPLQHDVKWSGKGVNAFLAGKRPTPKDVFNRLVEVIDHYIDFHKSLADQKTMCEFVACFVLTTWLLDAFNVTGYLWINGERGSGKSILLLLISKLSYLGSFITPSGSFASLRDMADYRGTLACDDAENITNPRMIDPDKMALFLAGNRKGLTVPFKEQGVDKNWHTRYVNAYAPRAFSAIRVPDPTLASRCIIVPMLRTSNSAKGNIDPLDHEIWPHSRTALIDDLWGLALISLTKMSRYDKLVAKNTKLVGRNLQPWRAPLAISYWLEESGVQGLYQRIEALSMDYQAQRPELEIADHTRIVIQAVCACAIDAVQANSASSKPMQVIVKVEDVVNSAQKIIEEDELDINPSSLNNRNIGRTLAKLRFPEASRHGGKGSRLRLIDLKDLANLAASYKIDFHAQLLSLGVLSEEPPVVTGPSGIDGSNGSKHVGNVGHDSSVDFGEMDSSDFDEGFWERIVNR